MLQSSERGRYYYLRQASARLNENERAIPIQTPESPIRPSFHLSGARWLFQTAKQSIERTAKPYSSTVKRANLMKIPPGMPEKNGLEPNISSLSCKLVTVPVCNSSPLKRQTAR
ncbi:hypothetical protein V7S43_017165 [Phytophthora oleae]|uniref:Uncharacterized protein n=1 Tax=Phytophthora oleae TaxID=2107226 RepID=A0ABD3ETX8_9STRA